MKIYLMLGLTLLTCACTTIEEKKTLVGEEKAIARLQQIELWEEREHYKKRLRDEEEYRIAQARDEENYRKRQNRDFYKYQTDRQRKLDHLQDDKIVIQNEGQRLNNTAGFINSVKDDYQTTRQKRRDYIDDMGRHYMNKAEAINKANEYKTRQSTNLTIIK